MEQIPTACSLWLWQSNIDLIDARHRQNGRHHTTSRTHIPVVDISPFLKSPSSDAADQVVRQMRHACHTYGFFYLVGHGVSEEVRRGHLDRAKLFFTLSEEEKMDVWIGKCMGKSHRGYEPSGIQTHKEGLKPDTKEAFIIGREVPADDPTAGTFSTGPNLWPKALADEDFKTPILNYQADMLELSKVLLKILARGLPAEWGVTEETMLEFAETPSMPMRLLHYAPQPFKDPSQFGVGDHTDYGGITILLAEDNSKGLEVWYPPTETWIEVPIIPGSYVINMGDMMHHWTNGYYRSARHRVVSWNTSEPRYSAPWFLNGKLDLQCAALDGSGASTTPAEHIMARLMATMGDRSGKKLAE